MVVWRGTPDVMGAEWTMLVKGKRGLRVPGVRVVKVMAKAAGHAAAPTCSGIALTKGA